MTKAQEIALHIKAIVEAKAENNAKVKANLQEINRLRDENGALRAENKSLTLQIEAKRAERQLVLANQRSEKEARSEENKSKALFRDKATVEKAQATIQRILAKYGKPRPVPMLVAAE